MDITEITILHHVGIVFVVLWLLSSFNLCHPLAYFISLFYLYQIHERYVTKLRKKLQFEEKRQANQKRVLSDSETVRWLNHAVEKIWPICMEKIASQRVLLPIIPWFLEKYKPWTAKKAVVQELYLGRSPPIFTEMRVLRQSTDDDHLVLQLGMNFVTADDMSAILSVKLRKRLGFGMSAKLHITGMHVEGKVLIGVKFLDKWPFLGRLRVCFVEPPYFQMTVKPIFTHGLDVTELPGIAGWLDKLLATAFEETLVEPNMLVVNVEKFVSPGEVPWFSVDEKKPIAYANVEVLEGSDMKPSDLNGLADPYVKGKMGSYRFRTKIQKKTLTPKWQEEFRIPICSWDSPNILDIEVRDKDIVVDDLLGNCSVDLSDIRDGQRYDMWLSLQNIKMGRLRLAITVVDSDGKELDRSWNEDAGKCEENRRESFTSENVDKGSFSSRSSEKTPRVKDEFQPIDVEGQKETGIWIQHPGSDVSQTWMPRKGPNRQLDTRVDSFGSPKSVPAEEGSSTDENVEGDGGRKRDSLRRGLQKIGSVFHRSPKTEDKDNSSSVGDIEEINANERGHVKFIVDKNISGLSALQVSEADNISVSTEGSYPESPGKGNVKGKAKGFIKNAGKSIKHALSRKGSRNFGDSGYVSTPREFSTRSNEESDNEESKSNENFAETGLIEPDMKITESIEEEGLRGTNGNDDGTRSSNASQGDGKGSIDISSKSQLPEEDLGR